MIFSKSTVIVSLLILPLSFTLGCSENSLFSGNSNSSTEGEPSKSDDDFPDTGPILEDGSEEIPDKIAVPPTIVTGAYIVGITCGRAEVVTPIPGIDYIGCKTENTEEDQKTLDEYDLTASTSDSDEKTKLDETTEGQTTSWQKVWKSNRYSETAHLVIDAKKEDGTFVTVFDEPLTDLLQTKVFTSFLRETCSDTERCYETITAWLNADAGIDFDELGCADRDLVCAKTRASLNIGGPWTTGDTTGSIIENWTTSEEFFITIRTTGEARHKGVNPTENEFIIAPLAASSDGILVRVDHTVFDGLAFNGSGGNDADGIKVEAKNNVISNCVFVDTTSTNSDAVVLKASDTSFHVISTNFYGSESSAIRIRAEEGSSTQRNSKIFLKDINVYQSCTGDPLCNSDRTGVGTDMNFEYSNVEFTIINTHVNSSGAIGAFNLRGFSTRATLSADSRDNSSSDATAPGTNPTFNSRLQ